MKVSIRIKNVINPFIFPAYLGVRVNLESALGDGDGRDLGDVVVLSLPLLLLELERDTSDGSLLNSLHQVGGEPGDLVTESLGGDDGNLVGDSLVGAVKVRIDCK